jgi:hypothetical protein
VLEQEKHVIYTGIGMVINLFNVKKFLGDAIKRAKILFPFFNKTFRFPFMNKPQDITVARTKKWSTMIEQ